MSWIRKWKSSKKEYSWKFIERACREITNTYHAPPPSTIIGLSRGGWVPAITLANMMNVREVYSIGIASYETANGCAEDIQGELRTYQKIPVNCPGFSNGEPVLIVDDISDKGHTLSRVVSNIKSIFGNHIQTATIFTKESTTFIPDYYYSRISDDEWVVFPWEKR